MSLERIAKSTEHLITLIKNDYKSWNSISYPWFRGEPNKPETALKPKLYRKNHNENRLLQQFRMKAPSIGIQNIPPRDHTDQWLFLAQHVGLPTRLLDWTEGLFIALYFALKEEEPIIWMLDPIELNKMSDPTIDDSAFPLTWLDWSKDPATSLELNDIAISLNLGMEYKDLNRHKKIKRTKSTPNLGNFNIKAAWENGRVHNWGTEFPVAILPTNIHPRMNTQKSCFTIQGKDERSLAEMVDENILIKYVLDTNNIDDFKLDLKMMGITHTSVFPDLDRLADELEELF